MTRPQTLARRILSAKPRRVLQQPDAKVREVRTARHRDQSQRRLEKEVRNLVLYGVPVGSLLAHVAEVAAAAEEEIEE